MEDKTFEFLEKILAEVQDTKKQVTKMQLDIECDIKPKVQLALEKLDMVNDKLKEHDHRFDTIESKIESHDIEITVLKQAK